MVVYWTEVAQIQDARQREPAQTRTVAREADGKPNRALKGSIVFENFAQLFL